MNFKKFVSDIEKNNWKVFGTEVYLDGELKHSYGDTTGLHEIYSATKTILSIAVGILFDEGRINLDAPVTDYLPEDKIKALPERQYDSFSRLSIRRLLTMSVSGFPFRAEGDNWLDFTLACEVDPDDSGFNYSNVSAYLISVVLETILGRDGGVQTPELGNDLGSVQPPEPGNDLGSVQKNSAEGTCGNEEENARKNDLGKLIEERILKPLDITSYEYVRAPEGYFYGASGMRLSVHDLSKLGLLLYNKGVYNGRRIISEEYVDMATSRQQMNREGGYGFYIWKYRGGFSINGKWKQKCYILPKQGIIVTFLSHIEADSNALIESMEENILGIGQREREAFERIAKMEEIFDRVSAGNRDANDLKLLDEYYTSDDWKWDFSLDEAGLLPANLKCGVLSEDGIYNLLDGLQS